MNMCHLAPSKNISSFHTQCFWRNIHTGNCEPLTPRVGRGIVVLVTALVFFAFAIGGAISTYAADGASDQINNAANKVGETVKEAGASAKSGLEKFWNRIDEKRLVNRTRDQIAAWIIMGLLVAGLIGRVSKLNWFATLLLGLAGAFVGGIAQNLIRFDFGMGPVLISYEELLASFLGAALVIICARLVASRKTPQK